MNAGWRLTGLQGEEFLSCLALAELPWLNHGFATRRNKAGEARHYAYHVGSAADLAARSRRCFLSALGPDPEALIMAEQVHGTKVVPVGLADYGAGASDHSSAIPGADGLITKTPGLVLGILTADCAPILLADPDARVVAAVHAGWRGATGGIAAEAVAMMRDVLGAEPSQMLAAIGPVIGPCCYRVGSEVTALVPAAARSWVVIPREDGDYLDLPALNSWWLRESGLRADRIFTAAECTLCRPDLYYSHRGRPREAGRMLAVISRRT